MGTVFPPNQITNILKQLGYIGITNKEGPFSGQGQEVRAEIHNGSAEFRKISKISFQALMVNKEKS